MTNHSCNPWIRSLNSTMNFAEVLWVNWEWLIQRFTHIRLLSMFWKPDAIRLVALHVGSSLEATPSLATFRLREWFLYISKITSLDESATPHECVELPMFNLLSTLGPLQGSVTKFPINILKGTIDLVRVPDNQSSLHNYFSVSRAPSWHSRSVYVLYFYVCFTRLSYCSVGEREEKALVVTEEEQIVISISCAI